MPVQNILVIKLRYIGDVLLATPLFRALKMAFPNGRVTAAVNRGTEPILNLNPDVDEILVVEKGSVGQQIKCALDVRRRRFDCVLDLTDGDRSAMLSWLSGAPVRIGFNQEHRWRGRLYTSVTNPPAHERHRIERDLAVLHPLGIAPKAGPLVLNVSHQDEDTARQILQDIGAGKGPSPEPLVMLQPGARYWFKAWPAERFAELADRLASAYGCRVLIGGDRSDVSVAEKIRQLARSAPYVLAGRSTVLQFAAILKGCALFVGNDNGAMHIAAAMGTPLVALFGPSNPAEWGPRGGPVEVIYKGLDCRPCFHPTCRRGEGNCMNLISADEVFAAAARLLGSRRTAHDHV